MFQLLIIQSLNETFIKISADELIAIRNKHHIDSSTFFAHFSSSQEKRDFMKEIGDAYEKKDKQKLLTIKRDIDQLPNSRQKKYYQLFQMN
ncbi:hypothetical protein [Lactobacillus taiwanensis]|uniref:hypothetical protein n=1 Tax=Lactobacillus taiwanensis TaxID=508451 RepID=UPI00211AB174|nr:hypothetical protein [Lactobacillus taiwanensis]